MYFICKCISLPFFSVDYSIGLHDGADATRRTNRAVSLLCVICSYLQVYVSYNVLSFYSIFFFILAYIFYSKYILHVYRSMDHFVLMAVVLET